MNETNVTIYSILRTIRTYNTCVIFFVKMHCDSRKKKKEKKKESKDLYFIMPLQPTFMHVSCAINNAFNATLFVRAMRAIVMRDSWLQKHE